MIHRINPPQHTKAIGAYSAAACIETGKGRLLFISGQVASDENGTITGNTMTEQAEHVFRKIEGLLRENGGSLDCLVSVVIYLSDMAHFEEFNTVRNRYLTAVKPASTLIQVGALAIAGHLVEISGVAYVE